MTQTKGEKLDDIMKRGINEIVDSAFSLIKK